MDPDQELVLIFGGLHVISLVLGGVLFVMFLRSDSTKAWEPPDADDSDDEGGGGGNDRVQHGPKPRPTGGVPLPDAEPAPVRLRGHQRMKDLWPRPERRRVVEPAPARPRVPHR
jgi:hypothetical protein